MSILSRLINSTISSAFCPKNIRNKLLNISGASIDSTVKIEPGCYFQSHSISIGYKSFINRNTLFIDGGRGETLSIGSEVLIGPNCLFSGSTHQINNKSSRRAGIRFSAPINIKNGCWLGANVTVFPGVEIAEGCIIGAGAVVTKNTLPNGLYVGIPAKRVKDL